MAFSLSGAINGASAGASTGNPYLAAAGGILGAFTGSGGSAKRAAANAARIENEVAARQNDAAKAALAPYTQGGAQASQTLSALMGLDNFDRDAIAKQLKAKNPDLFAQTPTVETRSRPSDSPSYAKYGQGTQYLVNGEWIDTPDYAKEFYTPEQNAAIDAEIAKLKSDPSYGSLTKEFSLSDYIADPGYQFRLDEGNKAIERAQARRGNFYSGAALKEADRYNSGMASQEYGSAYDRYNNNKSLLYNRLAGIRDSGQNAVNAQIGAGQNQVNNAVNAAYSDANAKIANNTANSNAMNQAIGNLVKNGGSYYQKLSSYFA